MDQKQSWETAEELDMKVGVALPVGGDVDPSTGSTHTVGRPVSDWTQPAGTIDGRPSDSVLGFSLEGISLPPPLQSMLDKYKQFVGGESVLVVKPWTDFFHLPPRHRMKETLLANLHKYKINYGILTMLAMLVTILLNITECIWLMVLVPIWFVFLKKTSDPNWESIQFGNFTLSRGGQLTALASITALLLLLVVGPILFPIAMVSAGAIALHAVSHPSPLEDAEGPISAPQVIGNECGP